MAWDQQAYDPNWGQQQYYDPSYGYDPNAYYGYDQYADYPQEPQGDTESEKARKDQERREALESNRLYLQKVNKQCAKEDFADLKKLQLYLFEVLIESLEVNSESTLGLVPDDDTVPSYVTVKAQFLNSQYLEICDKDKVIEGGPRGSDAQQTEYFQTIGEAGLYQEAPEDYRGSVVPPEEEEGEVKFTTKWDNASGKSCLFSMTALEMIEDLKHFPVTIQVNRCVVDSEGSEKCEPLGYARIRLPDDFSLSVLQSCKDGVIMPVSSVHRETCQVRNVFGVKKGQIEAFVRLSSFGPAIITSFKTVGGGRQYVFQASPLSAHFPEDKHQKVHNEELRPIIAEEEVAVGISVIKEEDIFQKPVVWKNGPTSCVFMNEGDCFRNEILKGTSQAASKSSMRLPFPSEVSLCRDARPPTDNSKMKKFGKPLCDWHNLVGLEIKNSPGGNCGCLDSKSAALTHKKYNSEGEKERYHMFERASRVKKISQMYNMKAPTAAFGLKPEEKDCGCDCSEIREALRSNKLFSI